MTNVLLGGELVLFGDVGDFFGDGSGFNAKDIVEALVMFSDEDEITVRINSGGGSVWEGVAIFNALRAHPARVKVIVEGIAASAASVIAMAGDEIVMQPGSTMMIHEPMSDTYAGSAGDHEASAAALEQLAEQIAEIYALRTGISADDAREMMLAETWMTSSDAVSLGFASGLAEPSTEQGDDEMSKTVADAKASKKVKAEAEDDEDPENAVAAAVAETEEDEEPSNEVDEDEPKNEADEDEDDDEPENSVAARAVAKFNYRNAPKNLRQGKKAPKAAARVDNTGAIFNRCRDAGLSMEQTNAVIAKSKGSLSMAKNAIIDTLADRDPSQTGRSQPARVVADGRDKFVEGATKAIWARAGVKGGERNEFAGMTMAELARQCLDLNGVTMKFSDRMAMVGAAMNPQLAGVAFSPRMNSAGMHSSSDFAEILANTAYKSMMIGYEEAEETFTAWTARGTLTDFKVASRVDLGLFPSLTEVPEGAEYKYATMGERQRPIQLATYGKMFSITRQAIINDDLSAFTRVPSRMGRAAKRTIGNLVYALLTDNPTMGDAVALFHANHGNLSSGGAAAPTVESVDAARAAMALQTDADGVASALNLRPAYFLVPVELEGVAKSLMAAQYDPAATTLAAPNYVAGLAQVISEARLSVNSSTAWYLAAAPNATDTVEVAYLNGVETPTMEERPGWNVDGIEYKVRIDAGVQVLDHRGLNKNAGA